MSETDLIYIAGFFDGEGCITIDAWKSRKRQQFALRVRINNNDLEILTFIKNILGGSICIASRANEKHKTYKTCYAWAVACCSASRVLQKLLPYLKHTKKQALLALEFQELIQRGKFRGEKRLTDEELQKRQEIKQKISYLNKLCERSKRRSV